jgi:hypothetical protein
MPVNKSQPSEVIKVFFDGEDSGQALADISYEKFIELTRWEGSSDVAYDMYVRCNNMVDVTDYNEYSTVGHIELVLEQRYRGRVLKFKCVYDSDRDPEFNGGEYFKDITAPNPERSVETVAPSEKK